MIQFHMLTKSKEACEGIADLMLENGYTKDLRMEELTQLEWDAANKRKIEHVFHRITCLLRSSSFRPLVEEVTRKYGVEPRMFSMPVTQIEDDWAGEIRSTNVVNNN